MLRSRNTVRDAQIVVTNHALLLSALSQGQVAIVAAIETRLGVAAHDALQQHPTGHLQAPTFEKSRSGHHLATGYAIEIGRDALNLINTRQSLCE